MVDLLSTCGLLIASGVTAFVGMTFGLIILRTYANPTLPNGTAILPRQRVYGWVLFASQMVSAMSTLLYAFHV